ncbi:YchJ family protein [Kiloniella sp. b19]|uniref:YchJ family protein n=1 Tax=Kiloniella sp. GXU_MW_B19 TaxID=3141326 RepID=UPI0031D69710
MPESEACPCCSGLSYGNCCAPFHKGTARPETSEALMRSRYAAYVKQQIDYLRETLWPSEQRKFDALGTLQRATQSEWLGLEIVACEKGLADDQQGTVTFVARSRFEGMPFGETHEQREKSLFKRKAGRWYYVRALKE